MGKTLGISNLDYEKCNSCKCEFLERAQTISEERYFCGLVAFYNEYLIFGWKEDAENLRTRIPANCSYKKEIIRYLDKIKNT